MKYRFNLLRTKLMITAMSVLSGCYVTADGQIIWDQDAPRAASETPGYTGGGNHY